MRKVLIFGNGIGRTLDNNYFSLETALETAWDDPAVLTDAQRTLIRQCLPAEVIDSDPTVAPKSEEELDTLQRILAACDEILKQEQGSGPAWLTDEGKTFPSAIRSYIHRAACHFHQGPYFLPEEFSKPLIAFIDKTKSHVATLNYDELIYRSFVGSNLFNGFKCMIDGFSGPFDNDNLRRWYPQSQCYYLHLHGSPLFYTDAAGDIRKKSMSSLSSISGHSSRHLVLTHVAHKTSVISASPVLLAYWTRLVEAINESSGIMLIGYGGGDTHLNDLIKVHASDKQIEVVERAKPEYATEPGRSQRFKFWSDRLGKSPSAHWVENLLKHTYWEWEKP